MRHRRLNLRGAKQFAKQVARGVCLAKEGNQRLLKTATNQTPLPEHFLDLPWPIGLFPTAPLVGVPEDSLE
jgi:hypothetical protein